MAEKESKSAGILREVETLFTKSGFPKVTLRLKTKSKVLFNAEGEETVNKGRAIESLALPYQASEEELKSFKENLESFSHKEQAYELSLSKIKPRHCLRKGEKYVEIGGLNKLDDISPEATRLKYAIEHTGAPLLIVFWASWCEFSVEFVKDLRALVLENSKKMCIKIALVNIDEAILSAHEAVQANHLKDFENYWAGEWNADSRMVGRFEVMFAPQIIIVDLDSNIRFKGGISLPDLEEKISKYSSAPIYLQPKEFKDLYNKDFRAMIRKLFAQRTVAGMSAELITKRIITFKTGANGAWQEETRKRPVLKLDYNEKTEKEVQALISPLKGCPWKDSLVIRENVSSADNCAANLRFLKEQLGSHGLSSFPVEILKVREWNLGKDSVFCYSKNFEFKGPRVPLALKQNVESFHSSLEKFLLANPREKIEALLKFKIEPCLSTGEPFVPFKGAPILESKRSDNKPTTCLNVIWASWLSASYDSSSFLTAFLEKIKSHCEVNFYCLDETNNEVLEQVHQFPELANFYLLDQNCSSALSAYGVDSLPHAILVSEQDTLLFSSSLDKNTENTFLSLILQGKAEEKGPEEGCVISSAQHKHLKSILKSSAFQTRAQSFKFTSNFKLSLQLESVALVDFSAAAGPENGVRKIYKRPKIIFRARKSEGHVMEFLEEALMKELPRENWVMKTAFYKTVKINQGKTCSLCSSSLSEQRYHMLDPYSNIYYCMDCSQENSPAKITDNLVLIPRDQNDPNALIIDEFKLGQNVAKTCSNKSHKAICDECGESINGARWICLSCKPGAIMTGGLVDFCAACYKRLMEGLEASVKAKSHDVRNHLMLRVLFSTGKYDFY